MKKFLALTHTLYQAFVIVALLGAIWIGKIPNTMALLVSQSWGIEVSVALIVVVAIILSLVKAPWYMRNQTSLSFLLSAALVVVAMVLADSVWVQIGGVITCFFISYQSKNNAHNFKCALVPVTYLVSLIAIVIVLVKLVLTMTEVESLVWHEFQEITSALLLLGLSIIVCVFWQIGKIGWEASHQTLSNASSNKSWVWITITAVMTCGYLWVHFVGVGGVLLARVKGMIAPSFDFGLFYQMFNAMANGEGMMTTLERGYALSHLGIHISPIYYLWLPFFMLWQTATFLQMAQIVTVALGAIPTYLIAKRLNLKPIIARLMPAFYLMQVGIVSSHYYDVHENCFLAPLLLWLFWAYIAKQKLWFGLFATLTFAVKEDAAIYIGTLALWIIVRAYAEQDNRWKKEINTGVILMLVTVILFATEMFYLKQYGTGVMDWRYRNLQWNGAGSLLSLLPTMIVAPTYVFANLWNNLKLSYAITVMASLGFLPLLTRRLYNYILLLPFIFMHLATNYKLQYVFGYQYGYGTGTLLVIMALLIMSELQLTYPSAVAEQEHLRVNSRLALMLCLAFVVGSVSLFSSVSSIQGQRAMASKPQSQVIYNFLENLDHEASVCATTFLTTPLAKRQVLFDLEYHTPPLEKRLTDLVVIDCRFKQSVKQKQIGETYRSQGYVPMLEVPEGIEVLISPSYQAKRLE